MKSEIISKYLESIASLTGQEWLPNVEHISKDDFVKCSDLCEITPFFTQDLKPHCCYGNSFNFGFALSLRNLPNIKEVRYCEGYAVVAGVYPIEHSWLKIIFTDDSVRYVDPTFDLVLNNELEDFGERAVAFECSMKELSAILTETMAFGPFMGNPKYDKRLKK